MQSECNRGGNIKQVRLNRSPKYVVKIKRLIKTNWKNIWLISCQQQIMSCTPTTYSNWKFAVSVRKEVVMHHLSTAAENVDPFELEFSALINVKAAAVWGFMWEARSWAEPEDDGWGRWVSDPSLLWSRSPRPSSSICFYEAVFTAEHHIWSICMWSRDVHLSWYFSHLHLNIWKRAVILCLKNESPVSISIRIIFVIFVK